MNISIAQKNTSGNTHSSSIYKILVLALDASALNDTPAYLSFKSVIKSGSSNFVVQNVVLIRGVPSVFGTI